ncbi:hypothetical protein [Acinetobacter sp. YH16042]|uniref:hypothetical protein n=1 Tax=Acinetobacter sp. YH16042 TaxID=2601186 RepID=UPI0015D237D4|nr:hypothetical protein [Acinetobacter sp. YH16042]
MSSINVLEYNKTISAISFFIIFWGYVIYNFILLFFKVPAFLGGYFGFVSSLIFIFYFLSFKFVLTDVLNSSKFFAFCSVFCFLFALVASLASLLYSDLYNASIQSFEMLVYWFSFFILGFYFPFVDKRKLTKVSIFLVYLFLIYSVYYIYSENKFMLPFGTGDIDNENVSGYQGISRSIFIVGLLIISFSKRDCFLYINICVLTFLLFIIGSRSEFYAYILAIMVYHLVLSIKKKSTFVALCLIFTLFAFLFFTNYEFISQSRQFNIFDLKSDDSWVLREQMKELALTQLHNSPLFGHFGGHLEFYKGANYTGSYVHNILSGYINYGLFFLILFSIMCYLSFFYSLNRVYKNLNDQDWVFAFLITFVVAFLVSTTKPVFWTVTYLSWGVFMGTLYKKRLIVSS